MVLHRCNVKLGSPVVITGHALYNIYEVKGNTQHKAILSVSSLKLMHLNNEFFPSMLLLTLDILVIY